MRSITKSKNPSRNPKHRRALRAEHWEATTNTDNGQREERAIYTERNDWTSGDR